MAELDVKQVTVPQWLGIGAGVLIFIDSFLPWWSLSDEVGLGVPSALSSGNGWQMGFLAWFSILLLIAAAVIAALPLFGVAVPNGTLIWLGLAGLAFVLILIRWMTYDAGTEGMDIGDGSIGTILGLIIAAVSLAGAVMAFLGSRSAPASPPPAA